MATLAQKLATRPGAYYAVRETLSLPVTATANTDFTFTFPPKAINGNISVFTTTAYTAGTDAKLSVGSTAGGVDYVAAITIAAIAMQALTRVAAAAVTWLSPGGLTFNLRVVQTGTATAVGAATAVISYELPVS